MGAGAQAAALGEETLQALRRLLSEVKIVGVITYAIGLTRDFVNPARFAANPKDFVKRLLGLVWPSFDPDAPPARAEGRVQLGTLLGISLFRTLLMNRMADLARRFNHFVQSRGAGGRAGSGGLQRLLAESAFAIAAGAALTALRNHATTSLALVFRERLTRAVHERYFQQASYYHIGNLPGRKGIPDADQRVSTEIASVATRLTNLVSLLLKAVPPLLWFTFRLWRARGWRVAVVPHLYLLLAYEGAQVSPPLCTLLGQPLSMDVRLSWPCSPHHFTPHLDGMGRLAAWGHPPALHLCHLAFPTFVG